MDTANGLGKLLREARLRRGLTQEQVGDALGVEKSEISAFEVGRRKWPQQHIAALSRVLGLSQVEMAVAAGIIDRPEAMPPRPRYDDDRLRAIAEHWEQLTEHEQALMMIVLDRNLLRRGEEGVENLVRIVRHNGGETSATG